jgi:hypothetical protein
VARSLRPYMQDSVLRSGTSKLDAAQVQGTDLHHVDFAAKARPGTSKLEAAQVQGTAAAGCPRAQRAEPPAESGWSVDCPSTSSLQHLQQSSERPILLLLCSMQLARMSAVQPGPQKVGISTRVGIDPGVSPNLQVQVR